MSGWLCYYSIEAHRLGYCFGGPCGWKKEDSDE